MWFCWQFPEMQNCDSFVSGNYFAYGSCLSYKYTGATNDCKISYRFPLMEWLVAISDSRARECLTYQFDEYPYETNLLGNSYTVRPQYDFVSRNARL